MRITMACVALLGTLLVAGCGAENDTALEDDAASTEEGSLAASSEEASLAEFAGSWDLDVMNMAGDSLTTMILSANATGEGWTASFPGRDALPVRVLEVDSDSVTAEMGPYSSVLRPDVQVTSRFTSHVEGDMMTGTFSAVYEGEDLGADSVLVGRTEGARI